MPTRTVRLDEGSERILKEIRQATGMSVSDALKEGLRAARHRLGEPSADPYGVYRTLDLGPGGYARAPARSAKEAVRRLLRERRR